uniref:Myelin protein zero like 3 n=1 Tax=Equus caballus TaxID=9796 RepID=A0A9L0TGL8_HORSE
LPLPGGGSQESPHVASGKERSRRVSGGGCLLITTTHWGELISGVLHLSSGSFTLQLCCAWGVCIVVSLEIKADAHVRGYVGEKIKLKCTFRSTSSVTDKLTIDWTYRPPSSSRTESIFHYQSFQYPTTAGTFRDRISWVGDVYKGDASISISDPTIRDNGTFSCAVKNPPDVHHNIPLTELTVTERGFGTMLSSVALLSILVFIPSAAVVVLLLVRMGRKSAGLKKRGKSGYKKSSIEVSDDTDQDEDGCMARLCVRCAECLDSDSEEIY